MDFDIKSAMTIRLDDELPAYPSFVSGCRRAPRREAHLTEADKALAIRNALRYIPPQHHQQMAKEFAEKHGIPESEYKIVPAYALYSDKSPVTNGKMIIGKGE